MNFQGAEMRLRISVFNSLATGSFERQVRETLMLTKYNWQEESYALHELLEQSLMSDPKLN